MRIKVINNFMQTIDIVNCTVYVSCIVMMNSPVSLVYLGGDLTLFVLWINHYTYVRRPDSERCYRLLIIFIVSEDCVPSQFFCSILGDYIFALFLHSGLQVKHCFSEDFYSLQINK